MAIFPAYAYHAYGRVLDAEFAVPCILNAILFCIFVGPLIVYTLYTLVKYKRHAYSFHLMTTTTIGVAILEMLIVVSLGIQLIQEIRALRLDATLAETEIDKTRDILELGIGYAQSLERVAWVLQSMSQIALLLMVDALMTVRCWIIFRSYLLTAILCGLSITSSAFGFAAFAIYTPTDAISAGPRAHEISSQPLSLIEFAAVGRFLYIICSLIFSVIANGMVMSRIWLTTQNMSGLTKSRLLPVLRVIADSAVLQLVTLLAWSAVEFRLFIHDYRPGGVYIFQPDNAAVHIMGALAPLLLGVAYCLLIVRLGQGEPELSTTISTREINFRLAATSTSPNVEFGPTTGSLSVSADSLSISRYQRSSASDIDQRTFRHTSRK